MPPNTNAVLERPALYYPYIHIRDANWLKATLLCFGQVRRIVPQDFELNDSLAVRRFRDLKGNGGEPLLADEPASSEAVYHAQERLLERLSALPAKELKRFSRSATEKELEGDVEKFQIHRGKMDSLLDFFVSRELAWPSRGVKSKDAAAWFALHPKLGEAVMNSKNWVACTIEYGIGERWISRSCASFARKYPLSGSPSVPTTDSATWWPTPAAASRARRFCVEVVKNSSTAASAKDGEFETSTTTAAPSSASSRPSPVRALTPDLGDAARVT